MSATAHRTARCTHGMAPGICTERNCPHYDGGVTEETKYRSKRLRETVSCRRCGRNVPRTLIDPERRICLEPCAETIYAPRDTVPS